MDILDTSDKDKWSQINKPVVMADDAFARLTLEGGSTNWWALQVVTEGKNVIENGLHQSKIGIVIGSGANTSKFKDHGWLTCDIDSKHNPDLNVDANDIEEFLNPESQDYIFAECLTFDKTSQTGVSPSRLLNQANKLLKEGGVLIIETANFEGIPNTGVPKRDDYLELMAKHGFNAVVEVFEYHDMKDGKLEQKVIYYGKKVVNGFNNDVTISK